MKNYKPILTMIKAACTACVFMLAGLRSVPVCAQPVLQSADLHTGLSFDVYSLSNVSPSNLTATGANITWDLSAATIGSLVATVDFVDVASTGYASQYPDANFAMKFSQGGSVSYNLWKLTATTWEEVAINVGTGGLQTFSNPRNDLVFPFTFGITDTDTYQKNGQSASTVSHIYDAYGSVVLSTGTITNLIRDYSVDIGASTTQAIWWNASPVYPVIEADNNGVLLWKLSNTSAIENVSGSATLRIYPNPANNELHIMNATPVSKIEICDVTGRMLLASHTSVVDISSLACGAYLVNAFTKAGVTTTKFMKQ